MKITMRRNIGIIRLSIESARKRLKKGRDVHPPGEPGADLLVTGHIMHKVLSFEKMAIERAAIKFVRVPEPHKTKVWDREAPKHVL